MKAHLSTNQFIPVILTLETQAEVDAIHSVLNNSKLCDVLGFYDSQYESLEPFRTPETDKFHRKLTDILKK